MTFIRNMHMRICAQCSTATHFFLVYSYSTLNMIPKIKSKITYRHICEIITRLSPSEGVDPESPKNDRLSDKQTK